MPDAPSPGTAPNDRIRDAGKWLIGASAAVGAALIAGSQLSNIGSLPLCAARTETCFRLPLALVGAAIALGGIAYVMWRAVQILLPVEITIDELNDSWSKTSTWPMDWWWYRRKLSRRFPEIWYFRRNLSQIGNRDPAALIQSRTETWTAYAQSENDVLTADKASKASAKERMAAAKADWNQAVADVDSVLAAAQNQRLMGRFTGMLRQLLLATVITALGITLFAWASNPSPATADLAETSLVDADLRGADLTGVKLDGADLSDADLTAARLDGASLRAVVWRNTTCPDGTNSDRNNPATCLGHLTY